MKLHLNKCEKINKMFIFVQTYSEGGKQNEYRFTIKLQQW